MPVFSRLVSIALRVLQVISAVVCYVFTTPQPDNTSTILTNPPDRRGRRRLLSQPILPNPRLAAGALDLHRGDSGPVHSIRADMDDPFFFWVLCLAAYMPTSSSLLPECLFRLLTRKDGLIQLTSSSPSPGSPRSASWSTSSETISPATIQASSMIYSGLRSLCAVVGKRPRRSLLFRGVCGLFRVLWYALCLSPLSRGRS